MLKMKKIFSIILATLLLFAASPFVVVAQAEDDTTDLYILSKQCPQEYVDYANETVGSLLGSYNILNPYLGNPFSFCNMDSDIYYFPVYSNGLITHTFRVCLGKDGEPTGVLSPAFAADLNEVAFLTSELNPLRIVYETADEYAAVVFRLAGYEKEVQVTPITRAADKNVAVASGNGFAAINCIPVSPIQLTRAARASTEKVLPMKITEIQGNDHWCLAYCTAMVMRYKGVNKTAYQVMKDIHGSNVSTTTPMGNLKLIPYMKSYGFHTVKSESFPDYGKTYVAIATEIDNGRPIIFNMKNKNGNSAHAIIALGYENLKGTVTVWNPWYTYFERVGGLTNYTPAESTGSYYVAGYWYNNYR